MLFLICSLILGAMFSIAIIELALTYPNCAVPGKAMLEPPSINWVCATPQFNQP